MVVLLGLYGKTWLDLSPVLKNLFCFGNFPAWECHGNPTHWPSCAHKDWSEFSTHWPSCAHIYPLAGEQCKCAMHELMGRTLLTSPALDLPPSTKLTGLIVAPKLAWQTRAQNECNQRKVLLDDCQPLQSMFAKCLADGIKGGGNTIPLGPGSQ